LYIGNLQGEFYGTAYISDYYYDFVCGRDINHPEHLICRGPALPFGKKIFYRLFSLPEETTAYENFIMFTGVIPSPTGVACEIEPLWLVHGKEVGCYAATCWQNGSYLGGTENTCETPWPYEWMYTYP